MITLRQKMIFFTLAFVMTAGVLGGGAFYVFRGLEDSLEILSREVYHHKMHQDYRTSVVKFMETVRNWALKGESSYRAGYRGALALMNEKFGQVSKITRDIQQREELSNSYRELKKYADYIIKTEEPVGNIKVLAALRMLDIEEDSLLLRVDVIHGYSIESTMQVVSAGQRIRGNMMYYLILLIAFTLLTTGFLVILMRRVLEEPYREMLKASERVSSGDLTYRIGVTRKDEFGTIAGRFDHMVEGLEEADIKIRRKLTETELFLEVARIAGMTPELKEALGLIVETVAGKLSIDVAAIFLLNTEKKAFCYEACNKRDVPSDICFSIDSLISKKVLENLKPFIVGDTEELPEAERICKDLGSMLVAPIVRDHTCRGIFILGKHEPEGFGQDEADIASILAHTISTAVRNIELYGALKNQLKQISVVYELSKAITSVYEPEGLLRTIAEDAANLINAKGCIIRLIEDDMLNIKYSYGPLDKEKEVALPMGKGVAGWVAKEGRSLLIEDISKVPDEMGSQAMASRSVISVPLKVGEKIIGTLGLFDKLNEKGEPVSFGLDDLAVAEGFASISAIAIEKARMLDTERRRERAIREVEKRLNLIFESVQNGIITLDREYNITAANQYIEKWIDRPLGEILNKNAMDVFHEKGGICPHCAAKSTFENGDIYTITQSSGLNYADLASYPVWGEKGDVVEAIVLIQDITDRVLYQEEIMGLYREVMQTKEYIENLINSSADAIVTSDLDGVVKSWNPAAEETYGFVAEEAIGKYLPFVPDSLMEFERENIEKIKKGEVLKIETFRKRKDGAHIDVSLTLSPIKDAAGEIIGISGISRDITEKRRVEKELIRRNQELSRLFFISSAMRSTLDLDRLLRMVLTAVTMGDGLGFNRAILFLVDEESDSLKGALGVGPASPEEAWQAWEKLSIEKKTLRELMRDLEEGPLRKDSFLDRLSIGIEVPLSADTVLTRTVKQKTPFNVLDAKKEAIVDPVIIQQLGTEAYAVVPLVSRDKAIGALWVDNMFNRRPVTEEDMKFLSGFADQVASAVEAARLFQQVSRAEAELENIFRSISDMVFFTDRNYTIRNVNKAVVDKIGVPAEQIIGKKCFKIFHGMDEPWPACPHHKTVETMKPYVEELEDSHLKGVFLTSTSPIFDLERNFLGTVHVVRNVTEIKELQRKLQATERMAALGEVAAKVAHEIRNPLVSVGGFSRRLESKLEGNLKEYAQIISKEVTRLEAILKEILGFVREARISKRRVNLNEVVSGVIDLVASEIQDKGNGVRRDFRENEIMLLIDPDRMKEAFLNIISNANHATDGGNISVSVYRKEREAVVQVVDTGCGIKKEDINRIFDPFYTTRPTGTGLGLSIAKRIVEEHGGRIDVDSKWPGGGTDFRIVLPAKEE